LACVYGGCGAIAGGFEAGSGRGDGVRGGGVHVEEGGDVAGGEVGELGFEPGCEVALGEDVGGGDEGAFVCVVLCGGLGWSWGGGRERGAYADEGAEAV